MLLWSITTAQERCCSKFEMCQIIKPAFLYFKLLSTISVFGKCQLAINQLWKLESLHHTPEHPLLPGVKVRQLWYGLLPDVTHNPPLTLHRHDHHHHHHHGHHRGGHHQCLHRLFTSLIFWWTPQYVSWRPDSTHLNGSMVQISLGREICRSICKLMITSPHNLPTWLYANTGFLPGALGCLWRRRVSGVSEIFFLGIHCCDSCIFGLFLPMMSFPAKTFNISKEEGLCVFYQRLYSLV